MAERHGAWWGEEVIYFQKLYSMEGIMNLFRQFKLGNSFFSGSFRLNKAEMQGCKISEAEMQDIANKQMADTFSALMLSKHFSAIAKEDKGGFVDYKLDLIVVKIGDFKTLVEAAIQMISAEDIERIKGGNSMLCDGQKNEWIELNEDYPSTYPKEGVNVIVSDGQMYDVAYYIKSGTYKWVKVDLIKDDISDFNQFVITKWKYIY